MQLNSIAVMDVVAFGDNGTILAIQQVKPGQLSLCVGRRLCHLISAEFSCLCLLGSYYFSHCYMSSIASGGIFDLLDMHCSRAGRKTVQSPVI